MRSHFTAGGYVLPFLRQLTMAATCLTQAMAEEAPYVVVLGVAQDGGIPQTAQHADPAWSQVQQERYVVCLGLVDPISKERWMFEATPDFPAQLKLLDAESPRPAKPLPDGIFLTHAHMGHYTGLMFLGHESVGARGVPVYAMQKMADFLKSNGPWNQLVAYENIELRVLQEGKDVALNSRLRVETFAVPHRQEYSEVVGYRIIGPNASVLFIPDIDSWHELDAQGVSIELLIAGVDAAFLDGTFFQNGEVPGRDMSNFPHPFIRSSMERFAALPVSERAKIHFIHFNHTNRVARPGSSESQQVLEAGFGLAKRHLLVKL